MIHSLEELIDIEKLSQLLSSFYRITGIPSAVSNRNGDILISVGWRAVCSEYHYKNEQTKMKCLRSTLAHDFTRKINSKSTERYKSFQCPNGLHEIVALIIVENTLVGTITQGQFFYKEPKWNFFKRQAAKYGFDEKAYLDAIREVPIVTEEEIAPIILFLCDLSEMIVKESLVSLSNLRLQKQLEIREERYSLALKSSGYEVWDWDFINDKINYGLGWWESNGYAEVDMMNNVNTLFDMAEYMHPDDAKIWIKSLEDCHSGKIKEIELTNRTKDSSGEYHWLHVVGKVLCNSQTGEPERMIGTYNDITEFKNSQEKFNEQYKLLRTLQDAIPNPLSYKNVDGVYLDCNSAFLKYFNKEKSEIIGKKSEDIFTLEITDNPLDEARDNYEAKIFADDKDKGDVIINSAEVHKLDGTASGTIEVMTDITEYKKRESEIRYLSAHDGLTGCYNRIYFESKLVEYSEYPADKISVAMGDMNGLKLTNDVFGHYTGDQLIKKCANILKKASKGRYIVARWGGDEFAIIMPEAGEDEAAAFCSEVNRICSEAPKDPIQPSISIFYATKKNELHDLNFLMKKAEAVMYRIKMIASREVRNNMLVNLENSLYKDNPGLYNHGQNLIKYADMVSNKVDMTNEDKEKLILLARFHDIGKIALNKLALKKKHELTKEEREQMKVHCESGFRVAESIDELKPISKLILSHHECYDGSGYPYNLKGEKIPYLARWLHIIDSYDVLLGNMMHSDKIKTEEDVVNELAKGRGTRFDPEMLDIFLGLLKK